MDSLLVSLFCPGKTSFVKDILAWLFLNFLWKELWIFLVIIMSVTPWGGELQLSEDFLEKCFHCVQLVRSQVFEEKKMIDLDQQVRLEVPTRNKWDINLEKNVDLPEQLK